MKKFSLFLAIIFVLSLFFSLPAYAATSLSAPKNIKATKVTGSSITFTWTAVKGADSYDIFRYDPTSKNFMKIARTKSKSYTNNSLASGTTYKYKLQAVKGKVLGAFSSVLSKTTISSVPTGLTVTAATGTSVTVSWKAVTGASKYNIYISSSQKGTYKLKGSSKSTSYTISGLKKDQVVYVKITSANSSGESTKSGTVKGTAVLAKPDAPKNVVARALSDSVIYLTWDPVAGAKMYAIYSSFSANTGYVSLGTTSGTNIRITDNKAETTYYFIVTAINAGGEGMPSSYAVVQTLQSINTVKSELTEEINTKKAVIQDQITYANQQITAYIKRGMGSSGQVTQLRGYITTFTANLNTLTQLQDAVNNAPTLEVLATLKVKIEAVPVVHLH